MTTARQPGSTRSGSKASEGHTRGLVSAATTGSLGSPGARPLHDVGEQRALIFVVGALDVS